MHSVWAIERSNPVNTLKETNRYLTTMKIDDQWWFILLNLQFIIPFFIIEKNNGIIEICEPILSERLKMNIRENFTRKDS